jgi:hypothetical protein
LLFSQTQRRPNTATIVASSGAAVAALVDLRLRSLPRLIEPPTFIPRTRALQLQPAWLAWIEARLGGRLALAGLVALILVVATAVPAWAALQPGAAQPDVARVASSAGVTGTASSRLEDVGLRTVMQDFSVTQYQRIQAAVAGPGQLSFGFGNTVREAQIAQYGDTVSAQVMLPQIDGALQTKAAAVKYMTAMADYEAAQEAARQAAAPPPAGQYGAFDGNVDSSGSATGSISGAYITFYDCASGGFCGSMSSGDQVFAGAAACSYNLATGTRFTIDGDPSGRTYVCLDRGGGGPTWIDIWFYDPSDGYAWQGVVGNYGTINIIQ